MMGVRFGGGGGGRLGGFVMGLRFRRGSYVFVFGVFVFVSTSREERRSITGTA